MQSKWMCSMHLTVTLWVGQKNQGNILPVFVNYYQFSKKIAHVTDEQVKFWYIIIFLSLYPLI